MSSSNCHFTTILILKNTLLSLLSMDCLNGTEQPWDSKAPALSFNVVWPTKCWQDVSPIYVRYTQTMSYSLALRIKHPPKKKAKPQKSFFTVFFLDFTVNFCFFSVILNFFLLNLHNLSHYISSTRNITTKKILQLWFIFLSNL